MRQRIREDKDETARCPFCGQGIGVPEEIKTEAGGFLGGRCVCGAVYVCDPTGHNMGEAYLDALTYACGEDWMKFASMDSGSNYQEAVFNYDPRRHKLWETRDVRRDYSCKIIFIKVETKC